MSATSLPPDTPRFLLDENFSHWLGELLPRFNYEVQQVQRVTELGHPHPKVPGLRHKASDREIADWCAEHSRVLVTCDHDFSRRELRARVYLGQGLDVILCTRQPSGLREQLELIVFNYAKWVDALQRTRHHPQLWIQSRLRGGLKVRKG